MPANCRWRRLRTGAVYLIVEFSATLLFSFVSTVDSVYHTAVVKLNPLHLVPVCTALERKGPSLSLQCQSNAPGDRERWAACRPRSKVRRQLVALHRALSVGAAIPRFVRIAC